MENKENKKAVKRKLTKLVNKAVKRPATKVEKNDVIIINADDDKDIDKAKLLKSQGKAFKITGSRNRQYHIKRILKRM